MPGKGDCTTCGPMGAALRYNGAAQACAKRFPPGFARPGGSFVGVPVYDAVCRNAVFDAVAHRRFIYPDRFGCFYQRPVFFTV